MLDFCNYLFPWGIFIKLVCYWLFERMLESSSNLTFFYFLEGWLPIIKSDGVIYLFKLLMLEDYFLASLILKLGSNGWNCLLSRIALFLFYKTISLFVRLYLFVNFLSSLYFLSVFPIWSISSSFMKKAAFRFSSVCFFLLLPSSARYDCYF